MSNFSSLRLTGNASSKVGNVEFSDTVKEVLVEHPAGTPELLQENYQRGYDEATQLMKLQLDQQTLQLQECQLQAQQDIIELQQSFDLALQQSRASLLEATVSLALQTTDRLVHSELALSPAVEKVIQEALAEVIDRRDAELSLHPDELEQLQGLSSLRGLQLYPDAQLQRGELILRHRHGEIDGTIDGRIQVLKDLLEQELQVEAEDDNEGS